MKIQFLGILTLGLSIQLTNAAEEVRVDGSSTVYPMSEAVAEEFGATHKNVRIGVSASGTGGGFKKFCKGENDFSGASRPIKDTEAKLCAENGISFVELPVAYDGLAVVINPKNTWAKTLTVAELKKIWKPGSKITNWSQVRKGFPNEELKLYGAGADSGTFDYFTHAINGKERATRRDYTSSEDDNVLVMGVAGNKGALGYFGLAYYVENKSRLGIVAIAQQDGQKGVEPNQQTVASGSYQPLSRPIFIYVSKKSLKRPAVQNFAKYYVQNIGKLAPQVGYVSLGDTIYSSVLKRLEAQTTGSVYEKPNVDKKASLEILLK